jgi:hypothetical protein
MSVTDLFAGKYKHYPSLTRWHRNAIHFTILLFFEMGAKALPQSIDQERVYKKVNWLNITKA